MVRGCNAPVSMLSSCCGHFGTSLVFPQVTWGNSVILLWGLCHIMGEAVLNQCRSHEGKNKSATSLGNTIIIIGFASSYTAQLNYFLHMVELLCF